MGLMLMPGGSVGPPGLAAGEVRAGSGAGGLVVGCWDGVAGARVDLDQAAAEHIFHVNDFAGKAVDQT